MSIVNTIESGVAVVNKEDDSKFKIIKKLGKGKNHVKSAPYMVKM